MELSRILSQAAVRAPLAAGGRRRLFAALGEIAAEAYGLDAAAAAEALGEREALGPTGVGRGVALPHARMEGLDRVVGCFARLEKPIPFDAVDRQPVDLVFALFAPAASGVEHLRALAAVSRVMRDADVCAKLRANRDEQALHAIITEAPAARAA